MTLYDEPILELILLKVILKGWIYQLSAHVMNKFIYTHVITLQQLFDNEIAMLTQNHLLLHLLVILITTWVKIDGIDECVAELCVCLNQLFNEERTLLWARLLQYRLADCLFDALYLVVAVVCFKTLSDDHDAELTLVQVFNVVVDLFEDGVVDRHDHFTQNDACQLRLEFITDESVFQI